MNEPHCMTCGEELVCKNYHHTVTKYWCLECEKYWFKTTHIIVEWTSRKEVQGE
jgi:hypothetical protein